jgi:ATP-binding protein involved in chromosome partitioning
MEHEDHEVFSAEALDHASHPRNYGPLQNPNGHARIKGPCGDTMEFWLVALNDRVEQISFTTDGCGPSLACGSMATTLAQGKPIKDAAALTQQNILESLGGLPPDSEHCALLAANALKAACENYLKRREEDIKDSSTTCDSCGDKSCSASTRRKDESEEEFADRQKLQSRLCRIRHKIVVLSGKGGVGKSMVAVNLATALMMSGKRVGLLDIDIHGPSIPTMLGLEHDTIHGCEDGMLPIELGDMKIMSIGFLLRNQDEAVIWRGPMKIGAIKQFLKDVAWGDLDYLIIDSPPGTGDEPLSVCQLIGTLDGAVIVTTPQKVAAVDVRKSISFCRRLNVAVIGIIENMSGFVCPKCGEVTQILLSGGGKRIAEDMSVPFLGSIPMDPNIAEACDNGRAFIHHYAASPTADIMWRIIKPILAQSEAYESTTHISENLSKEKVK